MNYPEALNKTKTLLQQKHHAQALRVLNTLCALRSAKVRKKQDLGQLPPFGAENGHESQIPTRSREESALRLIGLKAPPVVGDARDHAANV